MLSDYQRKRRFDVMTMVAVTDGLVRLFSNDIAPVRMMRRLGLRAVSKIPAAKRFFMKQAMAERLSANK
jgi:2-octaprenyl-6-methoxyphenol hydroxylase